MGKYWSIIRKKVDDEIEVDPGFIISSMGLSHLLRLFEPYYVNFKMILFCIYPRWQTSFNLPTQLLPGMLYRVKQKSFFLHRRKQAMK